MTLYALLYAFPTVPSALLDDVYSVSDEDAGGAQWFNVSSIGSLLSVTEGMLRTSEVLEYSLPPTTSAEKISKSVFMEMDSLSDFFQLQLNHADVPSTCRDMYRCITAAYRALMASRITTRDELWTLLRRYQLIPLEYQLPGLERVDAGNRSALLQFCSELMVQWMQPYFAKHPLFYMPHLAAVADS